MKHDSELTRPTKIGLQGQEEESEGIILHNKETAAEGIGFAI